MQLAYNLNFFLLFEFMVCIYLLNIIFLQQMLDLLKKQKPSDSEEDDASLDRFATLPKNLNIPQMMTASVSIAPVKHEPKMTEIKHEVEDEELMETADDDDKPKNKG